MTEIGTPVRRREDYRFLTGQGTYTQLGPTSVYTYNALGYDTHNHLLYAMASDNTLLQIDSSGNVTPLVSVPGPVEDALLIRFPGILFVGWAPPTSKVLVGGAHPTQIKTGKRIIVQSHYFEIYNIIMSEIKNLKT